MIARPAVVNLSQVHRSSAICRIRAMLCEGPSCSSFTVGSESLQMNADGRTAERGPSGEISRSDFLLLRLLEFNFDLCGTFHTRNSMHFKNMETLRKGEVGRSRSLDSQTFRDTVDTASCHTTLLAVGQIRPTTFQGLDVLGFVHRSEFALTFPFSLLLFKLFPLDWSFSYQSLPCKIFSS